MYPIWNGFGDFVRSCGSPVDSESVSIVAWDGGSTFNKMLHATVASGGRVTIESTESSSSLAVFALLPTVKIEDMSRLHLISLSSINEAGGDRDEVWADLIDTVSDVIWLKNERELDGRHPRDIAFTKQKMIAAGNSPTYKAHTTNEDILDCPAFPFAIGTTDSGLYGLGKDRYFRKTDIKEELPSGEIGRGTAAASYEFLYGAVTRREAKRFLSNGSGPSIVVFGIPIWSTYAERFDFYYKIHSLAFKNIGHCFVGVPETIATVTTSAVKLESSGRLLCIDLGGGYTVCTAGDTTVTTGMNGRRHITNYMFKNLSLPFGQTNVVQWILSQCDMEARPEFIKYHLDEIILRLALHLPGLFKGAEKYGRVSDTVRLGFARLSDSGADLLWTSVHTEWVVNSVLMFLANLFGILRQENMLSTGSLGGTLHIQFVGKMAGQLRFQNIATSFLSELPADYLGDYKLMFDECVTTTGLLEVGKSTLLPRTGCQ